MARRRLTRYSTFSTTLPKFLPAPTHAAGDPRSPPRIQYRQRFVSVHGFQVIGTGLGRKGIK